MEKARAEAFSNGVLAVAITLLVLDLHVDATGHGSLSPSSPRPGPASPPISSASSSSA